MKPFKLAKYLAAFLAPLVLIACGGGGGGGGGSSATYLMSTSTPTLTASNYPGNWTTVGTVTPPSVSSKTETYSDGSTVILEDGSSSKPFSQNTLSGLSITDPSKYVTSTTATYNLIWGTPDQNGPGYANLFPSASTHLASHLNYMGVTVSGQGVVGPTLVQPSADVLAAWNAGWTGKGTNLLTIDNYSTIGACNDASTCHGVTTMMISDLVAPGATKYGLDWNGATPVKTIGGANITSQTSMSVVNMSYGSSAGASAATLDVLKGVTVISNLTVTNAVITKSAGNNSGQDTYSYTAGGDFLVKTLVDDSSVQARLLIVGALNKNGTVAIPATIASYSNFAGATAAASNRFVVANGNAPYANGGVTMNGANIGGYNSAPNNYGTSYAAPVVAGYASVVMSKFPNLTAASTSNIILDTARTDTLSCTPNCDPATYGKGEASLSRALAPVGRLR